MGTLNSFCGQMFLMIPRVVSLGSNLPLTLKCPQDFFCRLPGGALPPKVSDGEGGACDGASLPLVRHLSANTCTLSTNFLDLPIGFNAFCALALALGANAVASCTFLVLANLKLPARLCVGADLQLLSPRWLHLRLFCRCTRTW